MRKIYELRETTNRNTGKVRHYIDSKRVSKNDYWSAFDSRKEYCNGALVVSKNHIRSYCTIYKESFYNV